MPALSPTSVEVLKTVKEHPGISATEIGVYMGARPRLQYISAMLKMGFLQVTGIGERPSSNGELRMMNLYTITHRGSMILQRQLELLEEPKPKRPKVYAQLEEFHARPTAPPARPPMELKKRDTGCSVAASREQKSSYERYVEPPPTGRGYVQRKIRNIVNM